MAVNKFIGIGRICKTPEIKQVGEHTVLNNTIAINEGYKDKHGQKIDKTEFVKITAWNHPANIIHKYCQKGSQIYVEGSLQTREWQDNEGNKRYSTEVSVRNVQLLDSKSDGARQEAHRNQPQQNNNYPAPDQDDDFIEDDIPF